MSIEETKNLSSILTELYVVLNEIAVTIAGTADGFSCYDKCDLHVGFRVHAHIYNLSIRNVSYLINEDIRGVGVNLTLGLENIDITQPLVYEKHLIGKFFFTAKEASNEVNRQIINHVFDSIEYSAKCNYQNYVEAFSRIRNTFDIMKTHIEMIGAL